MAPTSLRAKPKDFLRTNKTSPQPALSSPAPQFLLQPYGMALLQGFPAQVPLPGYLPITFFFSLLSISDPECIFFLFLLWGDQSISFPSCMSPSVAGYFLQMMRLFSESVCSCKGQQAGWEASVCSSRHQAPVGGCCSRTDGGAAGVHPVLLGGQVF